MQSKCFMCNKPLRDMYGWGTWKLWLEYPCFTKVYIPKKEAIVFFGMCMKDALWTMENTPIAETMLYAKLQALEKNNSDS